MTADLSRRRFLVPELIQSSAMDCGPAALGSLLAGFGLSARYERLREACHTDVDGTSIDAIEDLACDLGLEAEQVMMPPDHVLLAEARALPAIAIVVNPLGTTHFVVVWKRLGRWLQVMDPATGRGWVDRDRFLGELYRHSQTVPAAAWREWVAGDEPLSTLRRRLADLGIPAAGAAVLIQAALEDPGWQAIAALDAATRFSRSLVAAGAIRRGPETRRLLETLIDDEARGETHGFAIPDRYWSVRAESTPRAAADHIVLRGAVLVRIKGLLDTARDNRAAATIGDSSPEKEPRFPISRQLLGFLRSEPRQTFLAFLAAAVSASVLVAVQALVFRGLFDLGGQLATIEQRFVAGVVLIVLLLTSLGLELPLATVAYGFGRRLEVRFRIELVGKLARLGERFFGSRLGSDLAQRGHSIHLLRDGPRLVSLLLRNILQIGVTLLAIAWLDPGSGPIAGLAAGVALAIPMGLAPVLDERDLRLRNHSGALSRFYLDALLGLIPIRHHGAGRAMRNEHERFLAAWARSAHRLERTKLLADTLAAISGYGFAAWLIFRHLQVDTTSTGTMLLLAYWAIQIQLLGQQTAIIAQQLPLQRSTAIRLIEPLAATPDAVPELAREPRRPEPRGASIALRDVEVVAGGHTILKGVDLEIARAEHVAIVGPSGAGKSTLIGLLLGWYQPASGAVELEGRPFDAAALEALRRQTAWVDPAVRLWNRSLIDNIRYGASPESGDRLTEAIEAAELRPLLETLPEGLETPLGEGGGLVSGGEGQRVRFARALMRPDARLVLLDEPFRGLDRDQRQRLLVRARAWWPHATLLCATHDLEDSRDFDRVVVVDQGRLVEQGEPTELLARDSRYRRLLDRQVRGRRDFMTTPGWRRLEMRAGRLVEAKK